MPSNMDNHPPGIPPSSPGYETRDANVRGVLGFLGILAIVLLLSALIAWGMFRHFAAESAEITAPSPFADVRQLPLGPQLQVEPGQEWEEFDARQKASIESYSWENRSAGTVRVPIELAMDLLVKKGLPLETKPNPGEAQKPSAAGGHKP
jgi:hypothetical protein